MAEPKLSLTLVLQGGTMVSQQVAEKNQKECMDDNTIIIYDSKTKKKEIIKFNTRKNNTAKQVIKMYKEAYEAMLKDSPSIKFNKVVSKKKGKLIRVWDTMSEDARIKEHCKLIAHDMKAISFDYFILED